MFCIPFVHFCLCVLLCDHTPAHDVFAFPASSSSSQRVDHDDDDDDEDDDDEDEDEDPLKDFAAKPTRLFSSSSTDENAEPAW